jgi:hypothetical protein
MGEQWMRTGQERGANGFGAARGDRDVGEGLEQAKTDLPRKFGATTQDNRMLGARGGCQYRDAKNDYPVLAGKIFSISLFIFCLLFFDFIFSINSWVLEL